MLKKKIPYCQPTQLMLSQTPGYGSPTSIHQFYCWAQHPLVWNILPGSCPAVSIPNSLCPLLAVGLSEEQQRPWHCVSSAQQYSKHPYVLSTILSSDSNHSPLSAAVKRVTQSSTNAQQQIIQWPSSCCLQQAIEEEGGDPDEIPVGSELTTKRMPKRTSKGMVSGYLIFAWH